MRINEPEASANETVEPIPVVIGNALAWYGPGSTARGVLLCGTYGFEQLCAYRPWRELARRLTAAGCPTLRIEYPGQGDSGDPSEAEIQSALDTVRGGIAFLRERAGADEIVLVGLRLGATLAALAARAGGVDRLALLAPFTTGKAFLREMTMQSRLIDRLPDRTPLSQEPGRFSVGGFHIPTETIADLTRIDLRAETAAPAPRILLLGDNVARLAAHYRGLGSAVTKAPLLGLPQLVGDSLFPRADEAAFDAVVAFAAEGAAARPPPPPPSAPAQIRGTVWREEVRRFGPGLVGTLCWPRVAPRPDTPTMLLLNSGLNVRSGFGRQTTALARRLAEMGIVSLRLDPRGIGDSADRADGSLPFFAPDALADVRAALDHLEREPDVGPFVVLGSCSGAFLAFNAACADTRLRAVLAINPSRLEVKSGTDIEAMVRDSFRVGVSYKARALQKAFWQRVIRREIRVSAILRAVGRDGLAVLRRRTARLSWLAPGGETVAGRATALRRRGARLRLIYGAGDMGLPLARAYFGTSRAGIARRLGYPISILAGVDHNMSTPAAQDEVFRLLTEVLGDVQCETGGTVEAEAPETLWARWRSRLASLVPTGSIPGCSTHWTAGGSTPEPRRVGQHFGPDTVSG